MDEWDKQKVTNALEQTGTVSTNPIDNLPVWMGRYTPEMTAAEVPTNAGYFDLGVAGMVAEPPKPITPTVLQVSNEFFGWDERKKEEFRTRVAMAGLDPQRMNDTQLASVWRGYVEQAAQYKVNGINRSPDEVLGLDQIAHEQRRLRELEEEKVQGPVTTTSTQTSTDLSTKMDAKAMLYTAAKTLLGRAPSEAEVGSFFANLNAEETANPTQVNTVSTTTPTTDAEGMQIDRTEVQSQTRTGGVSADAKSMMAMDAAKANPEYGAYQAGTKVHDAFMDLVFGKGY